MVPVIATFAPAIGLPPASVTAPVTWAGTRSFQSSSGFAAAGSVISGVTTGGGAAAAVGPDRGANPAATNPPTSTNAAASATFRAHDMRSPSRVNPATTGDTPA